jgi:hypothetical protein
MPAGKISMLKYFPICFSDSVVMTWKCLFSFLCSHTGMKCICMFIYIFTHFIRVHASVHVYEHAHVHVHLHIHVYVHVSGRPEGRIPWGWATSEDRIPGRGHIGGSVPPGGQHRRIGLAIEYLSEFESMFETSSDYE